MTAGVIGKSAAAGVAAAAAVSIVGSGVAAVLVSKEVIQGTPVMLLHGLAAFVGCMMAAVICREKVAWIMGASALGYYGLWLLAGVIFWGGPGGYAGPAAISVAVGAGAACLIMLIPRRTKHRFRHFHHR